MLPSIFTKQVSHLSKGVKNNIAAAAILDFADGAALQVVSKCPQRHYAGILVVPGPFSRLQKAKLSKFGPFVTKIVLFW